MLLLTAPGEGKVPISVEAWCGVRNPCHRADTPYGKVCRPSRVRHHVDRLQRRRAANSGGLCADGVRGVAGLATSLRSGPVDTSLLPLAEDDAALAAERDSRYRALHDRIAEAVAKVEAGTTRLAARETARVDDACADTGVEPQ